MLKKWLGTALLFVLIGIVVFNILQENKDGSTGDIKESKGGMIAPPESAGLEPGQMAPNFELETLGGKKLNLSDLRGEKVILNFWATWCPPCREEMPEMQKFHEDFGDKINIIAVNLTGSETKESDVKEFIDKYNYTYPILLDKNSQVGETYKAFTVPTTYFIGTDGKIQKERKVGPMSYEFMQETLESLE
ncbi:TlpA disulfide reductase family protein [Virgibacillus halodenitrificans]|uniref:TlpA family protein disulfide reductase n=1 Tax=Virgibacillus halodenitrificans TaxID=1482 RepID=UPI0024BFC6ED|nr:TlpA disulfide reductase family protein [Virgibacillus halodenitrificans]WHX27260.1 TlpA disulfide reductase family protein [Virgibacillus halodenitrificans]